MEALPAEIIQKIAFELNVLSAADVGAMKRTSKSLRHLLGEGSEGSDPFSLALHRSLAGALFCLRRGWGYAAVQAWKRGESSTRRRNEAVMLAAYIGPGTDAPAGYRGIGPALEYLLAGDRRRCVPHARKGAVLAYAVAGGHPGVFVRLFYDARVMSKVCIPHPYRLFKPIIAALAWGRVGAASMLSNWLADHASPDTNRKLRTTLSDMFYCDDITDHEEYIPLVSGVRVDPVLPENYKETLSLLCVFGAEKRVYMSAIARGNEEDCKWGFKQFFAEEQLKWPPAKKAKGGYVHFVGYLLERVSAALREEGRLLTTHFLDQYMHVFKCSELALHPPLPLDLIPGGWSLTYKDESEPRVSKPLSKATAFWEVLIYGHDAGRGFALKEPDMPLTRDRISLRHVSLLQHYRSQFFLHQLAQISLGKFPAAHPDDEWVVEVCKKILLHVAEQKYLYLGKAVEYNLVYDYPEILHKATGLDLDGLSAWKPE